ncbi:MAG: hypothetical protein QM674_18530 [Burkholderiaceae bacterium]
MKSLMLLPLLLIGSIAPARAFDPNSAMLGYARSDAVLMFEVRVKLPFGGEQRIFVSARNFKDASAQAEAKTGGKALGGRQIPLRVRTHRNKN